MVYGETSMDAKLKLDYTPAAGEYRVKFYLLRDGVYSEIAEDKPLYITFLMKPEQMTPLLVSALEVIPEIQQAMGSWVWFDARMKAIGKSGYTYEGKLALYAMKKGDASGKEYLLLETDARISDVAAYVENAYGTATVTPMMEPGEYVAYLKYDAGEGQMKKVDPESQNAASFVLKASEIPLLYVTKPIVVNDGNPVPLGSKGKVRLTVQSSVAYTGKLYVNAARYDGDGTYLDWVLTTQKEAGVVLEAGVPGEVEIEYFCNEQALLGQYEVTFVYSVGEYGYGLSLGEYASTATFTVAEKEAAPEPSLTSALVINGGNDVEQGSNGEIKLTLVCAGDFVADFYPAAVTADECLVINSSPVKVTLAPDVAQEVTLRYECLSDAPLGEYDLVIYYKEEGSQESLALDLGAYANSARFAVVKSTGIRDEITGQCRLLPQPGAFLLKNVAEKSRVQVLALNGSVLFKGIADDTELYIPMRNAASGVYIVTVEYPDGKTETLKGVLKQ